MDTFTLTIDADLLEDVLDYSEEYRVRYDADGDPEEYDYCYYYLSDEHGKKEIHPYLMDENNTKHYNFTMEGMLMVDIPERFRDLVMKRLENCDKSKWTLNATVLNCL